MPIRTPRVDVSVSETLRFAQKFLPRSIVTPVMAGGMERISDCVKTGMASYYLEWHLAESRKVDLLASLTLDQSAGLLGRLVTDSSLLESSKWVRFARFLAQWNEPGSVLNIGIPHIWLAFDYCEDRGDYDPPNVHFCVDSEFALRDIDPTTHTSGVAEELLEVLARHCFSNFIPEISPNLLSSIRSCVANLAPERDIVHLSLMHTRTPWAAKLNVTVAQARLRAFLSQIDWPGDVEFVCRLVDELCPGEPRIKCNIVLSSSVLPQFELELEYNRPLLEDPRRDRVLATLKARDILTDQDCTALRRWPGVSEQTYRGEVWPTQFMRWLDLKICVREGSKAIVKPYLGFAPFFSLCSSQVQQPGAAMA